MNKASWWTLPLAIAVSGCGKAPDATPAEPTVASAGAQDGPGESDAGSTSTAPPSPSQPSPPYLEQAEPAVPVRFRALGTEPFWAARIEGAELTYTTPEDPAGRIAALRRRDTAEGADFSGKLETAAIHLRVTKLSCSDGMSDRTYPLTVFLTLAGERQNGCAAPLD